MRPKLNNESHNAQSDLSNTQTPNTIDNTYLPFTCDAQKGHIHPLCNNPHTTLPCSNVDHASLYTEAEAAITAQGRSLLPQLAHTVGLTQSTLRIQSFSAIASKICATQRYRIFGGSAYQY